MHCAAVFLPLAFGTGKLGRPRAAADLLVFALFEVLQWQLYSGH